MSTREILRTTAVVLVLGLVGGAHPLTVVEATAPTIFEREPNNCFRDADDQIGSVSGGVRYVGSIEPASDVDYVQFTVTQDSTVVIETSGSTGDSMIYLHDAGGNELASNDDWDGGAWSRIERFLKAGTYYVEVRASRSSDVIRNYALTVKTTPFDGNDDFGTASPIGSVRVGGSLYHSAAINPASDVDYFSFQIGRPARVVIETSGSTGDSAIRLYDAEESQLAYNNDWGDGSWSRIERLLEAGTYYVQVREHGDDSAIPGYLLTVKASDLCNNEDQPNEDIASADPIGSVSENEYCGAIYPAGDVDYVQFEVTEQVAMVVIETSGFAGDSVIHLYDAGGYQLESDNDGGDAGWSRIERSLGAGIYYVKVRGRADDDVILEYVLTVKATDSTPIDLSSLRMTLAYVSEDLARR